MKLTVRTRNIIIAVLLAIIGILLLGYRIGSKIGDNASNTQLHAFSQEIQRYQMELNDKTVYVSKIEQEILTLKEAKKQGDISNKELKALNLKQVNEISNIKLRIDTLLTEISHNGTVIIDNSANNADSIQHYAIQLPFTFAKTDNWLTLDGSFNKVGILDISLKLNFDADLITGVGKDKKPTALLKTTCPYLGTVTFSSIKLDTPKDKKYNISLSVGYGACKSGLSPIVGLTFGRSILRF